MANEYLQRTPTSTGNRKVWTWSGWLKLNDTDVTPTNIFMARTIAGGSDYTYIDSNAGRIRFADDGPYDKKTTRKIRDSSGWFHLVCNLKTTSGSGDDRMNIYINGVLETDLSSQTNPVINYEATVNTIISHRIGNNTNSQYGEYNIADVFLVDGQALTPDVFGFYKEGKGYQSSGTTQATNFRPGQWSPHSPRKIKTEIERKGGFGVNGFYLPMNDRSNFGADFHCTPNSIITLKGEDLPQPRNGAPITTDAYVSQLRIDPYAANLVLAVPGISTATGSNLVTNGTFDSDVSGWGVSGGTFTWNNGRAQHVTTSNAPVYQQITGLTIGQRYTFQYTHYSGYSAAYINTNPVSSGNILALGDTISSSTIVKRGSFTATATSHYVVIYGIGSNTTIWDDVIVKQEDAPRDYSADIKGSGSNKTLTLNGAAAVGYEIPSYYGSAMDFSGNGTSSATGGTVVAASNSDFNMGTGDFTLEGWVYPDVLNQDSGVFSIGSGGTIVALSFTNGVFRYRGVNSSGTVAAIFISSPTYVEQQWYHVVLERHNGVNLLYVNGVTVGISDQSSNNINLSQGDAVIGSWSTSKTYGFDGKIQDVRFYKGIAKYKGSFDVPKPYTPVGFEGESWRQVSDTCKNNFCTLNPLANGNATGGSGALSYSNGNNTVTMSANSLNNATFGTVGMSTGQWYFEGRLDTAGGSHPFIGISSQIGISNAQNTTNFGQSGTGVYKGSGTLSAGDIVGVAVSFTSAGVGSTVTFYVNGSIDSSGTGHRDRFDGKENTWIPGVSLVNAGVWSINFGQNPTFSGTVTAGTYTDSNGKGLFKYAPPTGFLALCEDNLPTPAIANPGDHFKTVLWTGDGNSGRSITGLGFQPDFVWYKWRSSADSHGLFDSVRGATKRLRSNGTDVESTTSGLISFDSDGFSLGTDSSGNLSGGIYVAWCWKAGGAAVTNTDGALTSQVSVNQDAGFSIATYTTPDGAATTFGHGLGKKPAFALFKARNNSGNWAVYHQSLGTNTIRLSTTGPQDTSADAFNSTAPTDTLMYLGTWAGTNGTNINWVGYLWAEIEGFSKFGSYEGNGNADGPFVYCGFKPAWVMVKNTDTGSTLWLIADSSRFSTNPINSYLHAESFADEYGPLNGDSAYNWIDFLSNGFKLRQTGDSLNRNGETIIFAAFAESPFQTANAK